MREPNGLECPSCGCPLSEILQTRQRKEKIYRRRECTFCGKRFSTDEKMAEEPEKEKPT